METYQTLLSIKPEIESARDNLIQRKFASQFTQYLDSDKSNKSIYTFHASIADDLTKCKQNNSYSDFDYEFNICLFPTNEDKTYIIPMSSNTEMGDILDDYSWVNNFSFWDNTDPPANCSEEEWAERIITWERLLGKDMIPSNRCVLFTMIPWQSSIPFMDSEKIIPLMPSIKHRARTLASNRLLASRMEIPQQHFLYSDYLKACDWLAENQPSLELLAGEIEQILLPITEEDFK
jgi:hypothetical protein